MKTLEQFINENKLNEFKKINPRGYRQTELDDIVEIIGANTNPANFTAAILLDLDERFEILEEVMEYLP